MNKIYNFSKQDYNFDILVSNLFQNELNNLHKIKNQNYEIFTEVGKDSNTEFHQKFYKKLNEPWDEIINLYKDIWNESKKIFWNKNKNRYNF